LSKRLDLEALHAFMRGTFPDAHLWFTEGRNSVGKVVSNPNVGHGHRIQHGANGTTKEVYRIGFSATSTGISVYVLGLNDKTALAHRFGDSLGKAKVTGYCIAVRRLADVDLNTLHAALEYGMRDEDAE
jgi:hypothetical protein